MTIRSAMIVASLALAACSNNGNQDCDDIVDSRCEDDHSGQNDDTPTDDDPFTGDNTVNVQFVTEFGGVTEICEVTLACEGKSVTQASSTTFEIDADAENCTVTIGTNALQTKDGRPTHKSANGLTWTYSGPLSGFEDGTVVIPANWYFEAEELACVTRYEGQEPYEYTAFDVYVDGKNIFEVEGIASDGSWFEVLGDSFDYGGRALERGWSVLDLTIGANAANFTVDRITGTFDVSCTW